MKEYPWATQNATDLAMQADIGRAHAAAKLTKHGSCKAIEAVWGAFGQAYADGQCPGWQHTFKECPWANQNAMDLAMQAAFDRVQERPRATNMALI